MCTSRWGLLGAGIGYCSWALLLLLLALVRGRWSLALDVALPSLLVSLALWQLTVLAAAGSRSVFAGDAATQRAVLLGSVFAGIGVLLPLANVWVLPALLDDPELRHLLAATGSVAQLPPWLCGLFPALGCGLLARPLWLLLRRAP